MFSTLHCILYCIIYCKLYCKVYCSLIIKKLSSSLKLSFYILHNLILTKSKVQGVMDFRFITVHTYAIKEGSWHNIVSYTCKTHTLYNNF